MEEAYSPAWNAKRANLKKPRKRNKIEGNQESTSDMDLDEEVCHLEEEDHGKPGTSRSNLLSILAGREANVRVSKRDRRSLPSWLERDMLKKLSGVYCKLKPPPRSTIAAAFSPDGKYLASTHGDHTVKIICCRTGECLNVLPGHRRTPWVVTFHPRTSHILASGSLDHEVRIWNARSSECISTFKFGRPIASLAFHAHGDIIGIASGHQLYIWDYSRGLPSSTEEMDSNNGSETVGKVSILKTKRSLRAVHFHPFGVPLLLSAEVNDQDSTQDLPEAHCTTAWREALNDYNRNTISNNSSEGAAAAGSPIPNADANAWGNNNVSNDEEDANEREAGGNASGSSNGFDQAGSNDQGQQQGRNAAGTGRRWQGLSGIFRQTFSPSVYLGQGGQQANGNNNNNNNAAAQAAAAAAATAAMSQDLPCTVRLRLWSFDVNEPHKKLEKEILEIKHAVLCSEMGAHFSPCGRYLATCIACHPPPDMVIDNTPLGPVTALFYELRIYSMEAGSFGQILHARPIRAAHCLTSIRFSPTSEHLLLAYGRRHMTLLQSIVADRDTGSLIPIHTILEIYRVTDMQLVRVIPSAEDEVNVACFHPWPGGGIAYGTKEGKLRLLRHEKFDERDKSDPGTASIEDELLFAEIARDSDEIFE
jgi:activator-of-BECN1-regulated-autophagy protein 1